MKRNFNVLGDPKKAKALCITIVVAVLLATLWPLDPFPRNGVTWLKGANGIKFEKAGIAMSHEALSLPETSGQNAYSLEIFVRPANNKFSQTIAAFFNPKSGRELLVKEWIDGLFVTQDPSVRYDKSGTINFYVRHVFHPGTLVLVAISSGQSGTVVYVNGAQAEYFPNFQITRGDLSGDLVLGTSPIAYQPWRGEIRGLTVYTKELTPAEASQHFLTWTQSSRGQSAEMEGVIARYTFTESAGRQIHNEAASGPVLWIPPTFRIPDKPFLESPAKEFRSSGSYASEAVTNVVGFVPIGVVIFCYVAWTRNRWKALFSTIALCALLSCAIEILQYYIPKRGSGITDIITNTVGGALGALLTQWSLVRRLLEQIDILPSVE
ncbi:MAG TPA: VanZ family protein [Terriglobales bacterium]|nr:VanZ family protein [Terriglobales bacterium]